MYGGKNKQPRRGPNLGYTIIEVMIVLAVSGVMFVIAASFINGKQARSSFIAGTGQFGSMLQDVLEQVTDGRYSDIPLRCEGGTVIDGTPRDQGTNSSCVFLGKLFTDAGDGNAHNFKIVSYAGKRLDPTAGSATLSTVAPTAVDVLSTKQTIPQNLDVNVMCVVDADGSLQPQTFNIGFFQGLGNIDTTKGTYKRGAQVISIVYKNSANQIKQARSATIWMTDGQRTAKIVVGPNNGNLGVDVQQQGNAAAPTGAASCS